ncbi:calcium/sodium antiporter [Paraglaciecola aquimarina]|uniref:Calcium/sodium antiporter n=1 Tax=Paraglaciecola aquimarina TaxID=1235557 RepID=A0ABU3SS29_9ALTE|nr:calcium/sodium antiporter [Paraglaciecola aquimarina]MDU0352826.1 calcium/sodium antiporter [Paraglaciecola aquimarina]
MILEAGYFVIWLVVLSWAADRFVFGASVLARNIGVSPMIIGLTIVAMGSSAPEIMVSATASFNGVTDTAVGNALGSNITNIALVLGITALLKPLSIASSTLKKEMPLLLAVSLLAVYFLSDFELVRFEGITLMVLFFSVIGGLTWMSLNMEKGDPLQPETESEIPAGVATSKAVFWLIVGMILLPLSAYFMVGSAETIARYFGLSELVIGLTIIAIGTSLPELAASIAGVLKGEDDLALGNIIGSNIFNILAVLAMPWHHCTYGAIDVNAATRDSYVMLGLTALLLVFSFNFRGSRRINRVEGFCLIACFVGYQYLLFR